MIATLRAHALSSAIHITAIGFYPNARFHEMKRRGHDDFILMYCAEGKGNLNYEGREQRIHAGDVFILPPSVEHAYRADSEQPWTLYWCHFQGNEAQAFFDFIYADASSKLLCRNSDIDFLYRFKELLDAARESACLETMVHASNLLRHILTRIERNNRVQQEKNSHEKHDLSLKIPRIQQFMRSHLSKTLTLDELARFSHCSKYHFSREYHRLTGSAPLKHFNEMKMEHACFLLEQTTLSVSAIATQLGFEDALYFSRVFRKVYRQAPTEYRKNLLVSP
jgi:AraC-like DNA-binding protein